MAGNCKVEPAPEGDPRSRGGAPARPQDEPPRDLLEAPSQGPSTQASRRVSRTAAENLLDIIVAERANDGYELHRALFCLYPDNPVRLMCIRIIRHPAFDRAVMVLILVNCIQMAIQDPLLDRTSPEFAAAARSNVIVDAVLICLFTVEMFFKVVAMGFALHPNAYLRDRWNWLDFSVVCAGWVDLAATWAGDANSASVLSSLRAVRVLRPLRTLKQLPSMQALIASMLGSIPQMGNVVGILLFFLVVSGILGVQLFSGLLRHQCHVAGPDGVWTSTGDVCNPFGDALTYRCPPPAECRCGGSGLPPRLVVGSAGLRRSDCLQSDNPNFGITHFDHFWGAFITIFQSITLEGWTDNMYWAQDGVHTFVWIYYVLVVTFGAFLVVQLFLAVLSDAFNSESAKQAGGAPAAAPEYKDVDGDGIMDLDMTGRPWLQRRCYALVSAPAFRHSTHSAIVLNTVVMCCEYYGQPAEEERVLHALNYSLTGIFAVELGAKLVAMGPVNCMRDVFNRFDAMVVVLSLLEVGLDLGGKSFVNLAVLRTFRLMRLVRVFKLVRALKGLNHLMRALLDSLRSVSSLALLLLLLVLIYALLGLQLFGGIYTPPPRGRNSNYGGAEVPSANFDSFALACISIFVVLSGENWNEVYFDASNGLQTLSGKAADRELATFYFLSLFVLGNYIIVNLFTAIILNRLMDDETDQLTDEQKMSHVEGTGKIVFSFGSLVHVADEHAQRIQDGAGSRAVLAELHARPAACARALQPSERSSTNSLTQFIYKRAQRLSRNSTLISLNGGKASPPGLSTMAERPSGEDRSQHGHVRKGEARDDQTLGRSFTGAKGELLSALSSSALPDASPAVAEAGADRSLCLFSRAHPFRRACVHMLRDPNFDRVILTLICASSISLAYDTPTQTALTTRVLYVLNYFFTVAFAVETLIKVVALGFIWPAPSAYLRSAWNVMDFAIVSVSVLLLVLEEVGGTVVVQLAWLKAMRVVRALRPLRAANRISGMKKVVSSLFMAVPQCANVSLLMSAVVLVFAILGVQLFKGRFYECTDLASQTREECLANGGRWVNPPFGNFDHIGNGVLVLVEMVGLEGWPNVMFRGMYATEIGRAPVRDDRSGRVAYALYFIVWIFAGAFLVWSLFIGVVLDTFNDLRKKDDGTAFMTAEQQAWMEAQRTVYAMRPLRQATCPSSNPARQRAFRLIQSTTFEVAVLSAICANAVVMMLQWHDAPPRYALALQVLNYMFSIAFLAEMMLKLVALGVRQYVHNGWNAFDGLLVSLSVVDLTLELAGDSIATPLNPNILRVLRMFRVVRLLRAVKTAKGLRTLLVTLWSSLPALQNVGLLLGLVMYIYAIAGMYLFSDLPYGECLNRHANFRGFWIALLTLFRCSTGESWNCIMHDAMGGDWADNASRCAAGDEGTCGSTVVAAIYFLSYWILGQAILLNLVIGVILENFSAIGSENRPITVEQLEEFRETWLRFDPKGTFVVKSHQLLPIIAQLSTPLGLAGKKPAASRAQLLKLMRRIDVPDHNGELYFMETMTAIANSLVGVPLPLCNETRKIAREANKAASVRQSDNAEHSAMTSYLVSLLQHRYRFFASHRAQESSKGAHEPRLAKAEPSAGSDNIGKATSVAFERSPHEVSGQTVHQRCAKQTEKASTSSSSAKAAGVVPAMPD